MGLLSFFVWLGILFHFLLFVDLFVSCTRRGGCPVGSVSIGAVVAALMLNGDGNQAPLDLSLAMGLNTCFW